MLTASNAVSAGIDASVLVQAKQMEVFARLRDVVVTDVNPTTVHRKVRTLRGSADEPARFLKTFQLLSRGLMAAGGAEQRIRLHTVVLFPLVFAKLRFL